MEEGNMEPRAGLVVDMQVKLLRGGSRGRESLRNHGSRGAGYGSRSDSPTSFHGGFPKRGAFGVRFAPKARTAAEMAAVRILGALPRNNLAE